MRQNPWRIDADTLIEAITPNSYVIAGNDTYIVEQLGKVPQGRDEYLKKLKITGVLLEDDHLVVKTPIKDFKFDLGEIDLYKSEDTFTIGITGSMKRMISPAKGGGNYEVSTLTRKIQLRPVDKFHGA